VTDHTPTSPQPPLICVADVDTRLSCSCYCALCAHYLRDRRERQRRTTYRPTNDRRILNRL
jgi:hypothetical protein